MATLATETWTGTTGAAWPSQWTAFGNGSSTIQANAGRTTSAGSAYATAGSYLNSVSATNLRVLVDLTITNTSENYSYIGLRSDAATNATEYYVGISGGGTNVYIGTHSPGGGETTKASASTSFTPGTPIHLDARIIGNVLSVYAWQGATPPTAPTATWTDTNNFKTSAGRVTLFNTNGNTTSQRYSTWDDMTVSDGAELGSPTVTMTASSVMTATATVTTTNNSTLATDDFTGTNGDPWKSQWTITKDGSTSSTTTIQNNTGRIVNSSGKTDYLPGVTGTLNTIVNKHEFDVTVDLAFAAPATEQYFNLQARYASTSSNYGVVFFPHNGTNTLAVTVTTSSGQQSLSGDLAAGTWSANTFRRVRFQVYGTPDATNAETTQIKFKIWDPASAEPSTWLWEGTDNQMGAVNGTVAFESTNGFNGTAVTTYLDNLVVKGSPTTTVQKVATALGKSKATAVSTKVTAAALTATGLASATRTTVKVITSALTAPATSSATTTNKSTTRRPASEGMATASASATDSTVTPLASTAPAVASADADNAHQGVAASTATAKGSGSYSETGAHTSTGTATAKASASAVSSEVEQRASTATAKASASSAYVRQRGAAYTALAKASASQSDTGVHTNASTATGKASASSSSRKVSAKTPTALATAQASENHFHIGQPATTALGKAKATTVTDSSARDGNPISAVAKGSGSIPHTSLRTSTGTAAAAAKATATAVSVEVEQFWSTAPAKASASAVTPVVRRDSRTAPAKGSASRTGASVRTTTGTATARTLLSQVSAKVSQRTGTAAPAKASASALKGVVHISTGTGLAKASTTSTRSSVRTKATTGSAVASTSRVTRKVRALSSTATARAYALGPIRSNSRQMSSVAVAHASASAVKAKVVLVRNVDYSALLRGPRFTALLGDTVIGRTDANIRTAGSSEYLEVTVTETGSLPVLDVAVDIAVLPNTFEPLTNDWVAVPENLIVRNRNVLTARKLQTFSVQAGQRTSTYQVWVRIHDYPEVLVQRAGSFTVR